ncbi:Alpha/Beta hydrolase fold, partial [Sesbania bispinosa]
FLLVDLRCHGDSASIRKRGPHTVASAALDVLKLVRDLRMTPRVLVGHSFGGKVVLSMVDQAAKPLARPVRNRWHKKMDWKMLSPNKETKRTPVLEEFMTGYFTVLKNGDNSQDLTVARIPSEAHALVHGKCAEGEHTHGVHGDVIEAWVLDATPGKVRAGGDGEDHPAELISFLSTLPKEVSSKRDVVKALIQQGFSNDVAQWVVTNLRPTSSPGSRFSCVFDLRGIAEMYQSYEETNLWKIVEDVPRGVHVNFLKAERSLHRWALEDLQRIHAAEEIAAEEGGGVEMHVLEDAGHWVHADNPDGLFRILSSSFQGIKT